MISALIEKMNRTAEAIRNTDAHELRTMEVGDEWRQGDLRIIRLQDDFTAENAKQLKQMPSVRRQLAPGTTQGSRHELACDDGVTMYEIADATPLDGPVFTLSEPNSITHPEHGDVLNLPIGCYAVPGQRAFADELRRVAD